MFVEIVYLAQVVFVLVWLDIGVLCFLLCHPGSNGYVQFLHNMELGSYSLHSCAEVWMSIGLHLLYF